jgi:ubiquinone/menaquinone biosynthesis C-methylase UbiE
MSKPSVARHFDHHVQTFDRKYERRKGAISRLGDHFRKSIGGRFALTFDRLGPLKGKTILDVGCGSGRYTHAFLEREAKAVIGMDISERMLACTRQRLGEKGIQRCSLRHGDFLRLPVEEPVDFCVAMGFFDYIPDPVPYLRKMRICTREKVLASFPAWDWLWPQRWFRYRLRGCPIRAYRQVTLRKILKEAGLENCSIERVHRDYFVEAKSLRE